MFRRLRGKIGASWCSLAHGSLTWPLHGRYECRTCGRRYLAFREAPIADGNEEGAAAGTPAVRVRSARPSLGHV
jgi:hypothetical protein